MSKASGGWEGPERHKKDSQRNDNEPEEVKPVAHPEQQDHRLTEPLTERWSARTEFPEQELDAWIGHKSFLEALAEGYQVRSAKESFEGPDISVRGGSTPSVVIEERQGGRSGKGSANFSEQGEQSISVDEIKKEIEELNERVAELGEQHTRLTQSIRDNLVKPVAVGAALSLGTLAVVLAIAGSWLSFPAGIISLLFVTAVWVGSQ